MQQSILNCQKPIEYIQKFITLFNFQIGKLILAKAKVDL